MSSHLSGHAGNTRTFDQLHGNHTLNMTRKTTDNTGPSNLAFEARLWLTLFTALVLAPPVALRAADKPPETAKAATITEDLALNFHLMHPGGDSLPGDPNAAFCLDGTYHLHYILAHPWNGKGS
ncbi:MAG: hypothetical protein EXS31_11105, partial [Pedosphaera sp.]|nr:hypothetical protein [Pedosphaera sp.]